MRLFLFWPKRYHQTSSLIFALKKQGHEIVYWVGVSDKDGEEPELEGTVFHNHFDAFLNIPAKNIDANEFPPAGKDLIEHFYKIESISLTMLDKHFNGVCVGERKHIYYDMLRYWHGALNKYQPEALVFLAIPHSVYNYIAYEIARLLGIKTIVFDVSWVSDRALVYNDWRQGSLALKKEIENNKARDFSISDLADDIKEYYQTQIKNIQKGPNAVYMRSLASNFSTKNRLKRKIRILKETLGQGTVIKRGVGYVSKKFKEDLKKEYNTLTINPDLEKPFVYAPLGFQPEMTNCPLADVFMDQILMIETLSYGLPSGWSLYVKEHPGQWWLRTKTNYSDVRWPGYYRRIAKIKNTFLIPTTLDQFNLIEKSKAVALATGTAGWEALLRLKPSIAFGYPWYRDCPSLLRVSDGQSARAALEKIKNGYQIRQKDMINYLKSFDKVSIHGCLDPFILKTVGLGHRENLDNVSKAVISELDKFSASYGTK